MRIAMVSERDGPPAEFGAGHAGGRDIHAAESPVVMSRRGGGAVRTEPYGFRPACEVVLGTDSPEADTAAPVQEMPVPLVHGAWTASEAALERE
ncbi:hypothetical protein [Nocardia niwae]|uniref:hypothetical protein n=1 Tax=Nocardia niwae TaxID=626084 RepID=UPI0012F52846|nr:hypothetical protein [Nocardia niwae]